jgi:hypothetical protein
MIVRFGREKTLIVLCVDNSFCILYLLEILFGEEQRGSSISSTHMRQGMNACIGECNKDRY